MTDQPPTLREFFDEKFKRLEEQNDTAIELCQSMLAQQKITNGRVGAHDVKIAILQVGYTVGAAILAAGAFYIFGKLP